jgi:hypothetical protein
MFDMSLRKALSIGLRLTRDFWSCFLTFVHAGIVDVSNHMHLLIFSHLFLLHVLSPSPNFMFVLSSNKWDFFLSILFFLYFPFYTPSLLSLFFTERLFIDHYCYNYFFFTFPNLNLTIPYLSILFYTYFLFTSDSSPSALVFHNILCYSLVLFLLFSFHSYSY